MYAITGATGNTGRVVAESLLAEGKDVTVIGRSAEHLKPLVEKGGEAFVGSLDDAQAMALAFSGAVGVYCLVPERLDLDDLRAYQRQVGHSLAAAIHEAGVEYVVFLSSLGAHNGEGLGPISGLREQEDRLGALDGVNVLSLRAAFFMENLLRRIDTGIVGTPVKGDMPMAMIASRDVGEYAAKRLVALDYEGHSTRELLGPADITLEQATRAIGSAIAKDDLGYVQFSYEDAEQAFVSMGLSSSSAKLLSEMYRGFNDGLVVAEEDRSPESTTPTTIEEFAETFAQVYAASEGK
jgi:uncharacterized protein YbjT (DUF2867 family)